MLSWGRLMASVMVPPVFPERASGPRYDLRSDISDL
jgi:hypothetical protein